MAALLQGIELSRDRDALIRQGECTCFRFSSLLEGDVIFVHKNTDMSRLRRSPYVCQMSTAGRITQSLYGSADRYCFTDAQELEAR